jgi:hypothetical protein
VRNLAQNYGDWVPEALADLLTQDVEGTYHQGEQDRLLKCRHPAELTSQHVGASPASLPIALTDLDADADPPEPAWSGTISYLLDLIPTDFRRIPGEARLTRVEAEVWRFWLQGKTACQIAEWVIKGNGSRYGIRMIRHILHRAREKVEHCPYVGWRTCLLEDICRGRYSQSPNKVSWAELLGLGLDLNDL